MIDHYRRMIDDPVRVAAFRRAIEAAVEPGDVVVDLGCAFGNYAVFACRAGAARVYALDAGPIVVAAREVAAANGCDYRIRFLRGRSTDLEVPERGNVVIYEDCPTLVSPSALRTNRDAVERWLVGGARMIPDRARLWAAAVQADEAYAELDRFASSGERVADVDLRSTRHLAFCETTSVQLEESALLTEPAVGAEIDLHPMGEPSVDFWGRLPASRTGIVHGLLLWFEMALAETWLSTGPLTPPIAWKQVLFPLGTPLPVEADAPLDLSLQGGPFGDEMVWRWRVATPGGACGSSNLESMGLDPERLARWDPDTVPEPDEELRVDLTVLQLMDGTRSLGEIAERLAADYGERFGRAEDLQRRILEVARREQGRGT